jgi:hypothetical protein
MSNSFFVTRGVDICNNFVTLSDAQTILGEKTFNNTTKFYGLTTGQYNIFASNPLLMSNTTRLNVNYINFGNGGLTTSYAIQQIDAVGSGDYLRIGRANQSDFYIDSSGNITLNNITRFYNNVFLSQNNIYVNNAVPYPYMSINHPSGAVSASYFQVFTYNAVAIGSISQNGITSTIFNTSSDMRLKEDCGLSTDTSVIDNIKIHKFRWKTENHYEDIGVFAQEAYEIKPTAVYIGTDELTDDGRLKNPWGVDYSKFVPDLIAYCQQLKKQVQSQQDQIQSQQDQINALQTQINSIIDLINNK